MPDTRRLALFALHADGDFGLCNILRGTTRVTNLPADAEVVRIGYDLSSGNLLVLMESVEFCEHRIGEQVERRSLLCEKVRRTYTADEWLARTAAACDIARFEGEGGLCG